MLFMLIVWTVLVGLGIPGIVLAARALPWVDTRVLAGVKPWACDICMSFWTGAVLVLGAAAIAGALEVLAVAPPAYTIALVVLRHLQAPHGAPPPPDLPEG
jgi:hypothetical protein